MPETHHHYGPSTLNIRKESPCFRPKDDPNVHTERGTRLHWAMEHMDPSNLDPDEMWAYHEAIRKLHTTGLMVDFKWVDELVLTEKQLDLRAGGEILTFGTVDVISIDPQTKHAHVVDYKFGQWEVPQPKENMQLWAYGAAVLQTYDVDSVTIDIIQPTTVYCEYTMIAEDVSFYVDILQGIIEDSKTYVAEDRIKPSCKACMFCDKFNSCPGPIRMAEEIFN